jgi:electron transport complex protein RnfB
VLPLAAFLVLAVLIGAALLVSERALLPRLPTLVERIDRLLPQTQCTRCTFQGCRPYAEALAAGEADINQCPPGGTETVHALARLLNRPFTPVDPKFGVADQKLLVAFIDESACIGCALCIDPCPTDAIVGAQKFMHTVIAARCTGCELCIPACPVDCIDMRAAANG